MLIHSSDILSCEIQIVELSPVLILEIENFETHSEVSGVGLLAVPQESKNKHTENRQPFVHRRVL